MDERNPIEPIALFISAFVLSAVAGFAALLRQRGEITWRLLLSSVLNSGVLGLMMAFLLFSYFRESVWFLLGLCVLAGFGGMTLVGFVLFLVKQGGANIDIKINQPNDDAK